MWRDAEKVNPEFTTEYAFIIYLLVSFSMSYYSEITACWASAAQRRHSKNQFSPKILAKKNEKQLKCCHFNS